MNTSLEKHSFVKLYIFFCLAAVLLFASTTWLLVSDDIYYDAFGEQLSYERITEMLDFSKKWSWVIYPITPIIYLGKFFLVVICLSIGAFLFRLEISLTSLFKIAVLSEFVFLMPFLIKIIWFGFMNTHYTLSDLQHFAPLSLIGLLNTAAIPTWLIPPLRLINVFELAYVVTLSYFLARALKSELRLSLKLVLSSYGTGLVIWTIFVMFLIVNLGA